MARIESVALGGFYPTPPELVPLIASYLDRSLPPPPENRWAPSHDITALDPCAGEGAALLGLLEGVDKQRVNLYAIELEATRAKACEAAIRAWTDEQNPDVLRGDAFRVTWQARHGAVGLLYLNPPYDTDREHGRLEQRFLARFTAALGIGGVLVFVVPHHALAASAEYLGLHYADVHAFRFPGTAFDAFKQVVVFAHRTDERMLADDAIVANVRAWAAHGAFLPELALQAEPLYVVPARPDGGFQEWEMRAVDFTGLLAKHRPWHVTPRAGKGAPPEPLGEYVPVGAIQESLLRVYPVATPPRPAHIAAGIAAGIFNGARITPNDPATKLPPLLVKGVFDREYRAVEEKRNKDGDKTGEVQVQQPRLVTTVLDLERHTFHKLGEGVEASAGPPGRLSPSTMNVADLLTHYGEALMRSMAVQCPTLYEPVRDGASVTLCHSPRSPFTAQAHAAKALVTLLHQPDQTAILLGEIGSGKSTVSVLAARTFGAKRMLVLCPPHLLQSWRNEAAAVAPELAVHVLETVEDLDRLPAPGDQAAPPFLCILSREAAKLSHAIEQVHGECPKCGAPVPPGDLAKKRAHCEAQAFFAKDTLADAARLLAVHLTAYSRHGALAGVLRGRFDGVRLERQKRREPEDFAAPAGTTRALLARAFGELVSGHGDEEARTRAVFWLAHALAEPEWTAMAAAALFQGRKMGEDGNGWVRTFPDLARDLLLLLPEDHPAELYGKLQCASHYTTGSHAERRKTLRDGKELAPYELGKASLALAEDGVLTVDKTRPGSLGAWERALELLAHVGRWGLGAECGEPLYQAIPEPRRVSLAKHITKYHANAFDFVILDECHEYATEGSAQERAGHRLAGLGVPTIHMTGSVMNGYAESLFMTMWSVSSDFRREFARDDKSRFIDRFGYRKRLVEDRKDGKVVEFGSQTNRVVRSEKVIGNAPGVLPLFVLRHLLPVSVTLHKADLAIELPACKLVRHMVRPSARLSETYTHLLDKLVRQIKADLWVEGMAEKLFGQLSEIPSYLDRATRDVGNCETGAYEVRYPESCEGGVVASAPGFPSSEILPKERWMLDLVREELAAGRNAMVFSWHLSVLPRLARLLEAELGEAAPILYADKVATAKRQAWIDKEIVKKGRRVMLANPVAIQTGLNNLVHFATEVWMENPACNPLTYRQAVGRVDRIGQVRETRIHFPVYEGTLQEALYTLLMKKVAVSTATDGLDPEAALSAAGLGTDDALASLSIGKQLWAMLGEDGGAPMGRPTKSAKAA